MSDVPRACVIGWPVEHSRSPMIHGFWLKELGLDGRYEKVAVPPDRLNGFLDAMPSVGFVGGNVTIPHKEAAARRCGRLSGRAARLGGVNTVWFEDGVLCGDSTDGSGFVAALDAGTPGWDRSDGQALVLGAGGAARAIVDALLDRGFGRVFVANRTLSRATDLCARLGGTAVGLNALADLLPETDLLVNTTAVGMAGHGGELPLDVTALPSHAVVDDIVYVPLETPLLAASRAAGLRTVDGLGMLLHQAVPGFARWFGVEPKVTPGLRALLEADIAGAS